MIGERIKDQVRYEWAVAPEASAIGIARKFSYKYGDDLASSRTIEGVVAEAKAYSPATPFELKPWTPWLNEGGSPEATLFLLSLHREKLIDQKKGLYQHEARWALRFQKALEGLVAWRQLRIVQEYAEREMAAYHLNRIPDTGDLDAFLAFGMWRSKELQLEYEKALQVGDVPIPFLGASDAFLREVLKARGATPPVNNPIVRLLLDQADDLQPEWSDILLDFLDDPTDAPLALLEGWSPGAGDQNDPARRKIVATALTQPRLRRRDQKRRPVAAD